MPFITLSKEEIKKVETFASMVDVNPKSFGQRDSMKRDRTTMIRDMVVGKCGELAFQKYMRLTFGIEFELDFNIYSRKERDTQDALFNGYRFEIKTIKRGNWLMYEKDTMSMRYRTSDIPHYFVLVRFDIETGKAEIVGYIPFEAMADKKNLLKKGSILPSTKTPLKAENYSVHADQLLGNWKTLMYRVQEMNVTI